LAAEHRAVEFFANTFPDGQWPPLGPIDKSGRRAEQLALNTMRMQRNLIHFGFADA